MHDYYCNSSNRVKDNKNGSIMIMEWARKLMLRKHTTCSNPHNIGNKIVNKVALMSITRMITMMNENSILLFGIQMYTTRQLLMVMMK